MIEKDPSIQVKQTGKEMHQSAHLLEITTLLKRSSSAISHELSILQFPEDTTKAVSCVAMQNRIEQIREEILTVVHESPEKHEVQIDRENDSVISIIHESVEGSSKLDQNLFTQALTHGIANAEDVILSHFEPTIKRSNDELIVKFFPYIQRFAQKRLDENFDNGLGESVYSYPTRVKDVDIQYSYAPESNLPIRSLILYRK